MPRINQNDFDEKYGFGSAMPTRGLAKLKTAWELSHLKAGDTLGGIRIPAEWIKDGKLLPKDQRPKLKPK